MAGPFELAKLSAQVSVLMADKKNCPRPEMHKIAASYQSKGTLKTMANIVKHRGYTGLWTGLPFHLSGLSPCCPGVEAQADRRSEGYPRHRDLLCNV